MLVHLALAFGAGLAGSAHCVGMCGGFPLAIAAGGGRWTGQLLYHCGRLSSLAFLGCVAGIAGAACLAATPVVMATRLLALASGLLMTVVGLELLGWLPQMTTSWARGLHGTLVTLLGGTARSSSFMAPLALGALNAFLPCGLVYAAVASAASSASAVGGIVTMLAFGAGTVPSLLAVGIGARSGSLRWTARLRTVAATAFVVFGGVTVWRGLVPLCLHHLR